MNYLQEKKSRPGIPGAMNRLYNKEEVLGFVAGEKKAQEMMDKIYLSAGWNIDRSHACKKFDLYLYNNMYRARVEEKFRSADHDDLLIEFIQMIETRPPELGWYYYIEADYLNYIICDNWQPKKIYTLKWGSFTSWMLDYLKVTKFANAIFSPRGKGLTLNISINWLDIPNNLYKVKSL